jgi:putative DNA methylase
VKERGIYLTCGDSAGTSLPDRSVDLVVTDPPFFDNVHYSELADFFFAWMSESANASTRRSEEVQDLDPAGFARKLEAVLRECCRVLRDDGLLVFTYHHSREEGWSSLAAAIHGAGFVVVNSQPVKAEMSVATPKSQAKEPIQLDIILVCKKCGARPGPTPSFEDALAAGIQKLERLEDAGFALSRMDQKIVLIGQLLTAIYVADDVARCCALAEQALSTRRDRPIKRCSVAQGRLFGDE